MYKTAFNILKVNIFDRIRILENKSKRIDFLLNSKRN